MFSRLAKFIARNARKVVVTWVIAAVAMLTVALVGVSGEGLFDRVESGAPGVKGSDSAIVMERTRDAVPDDVGPTISALVQGVDVADPAVASTVVAQSDAIAMLDGVTTVVSPFGASLAPGVDPASVAGGGESTDLITTSGNGFLWQVSMETLSEEGAELAAHHDIEQRFADAVGQLGADATVLTYSSPLLYDDFTHQMKRDLVTGEAVALPLALIVMVLVFGGFLAASTPLIGALASIAGGMLVLYGFSYPIAMDDSAVNVVTVLGIGLSVDYGLLMVSRYREELTKRNLSDRWATEEALEATMVTAGRTVFFSAITVAIAVGGMLTFEPAILRGFGAAALGVVTMALIVALTLVPAIAFLLSHKIIAPSPVGRIPLLGRMLRSTSDVKRDHGAFSTLAFRVQRHPWLTLTAASALLLVLASPLLGLQMRNSQAELLPPSNERRVFLSEFATELAPLAEPAIVVLADTDTENLDAWLARDVTGIDGVTGLAPAVDQLDQARAGVLIEAKDGGSAEAVAVVRDIRALDPPFRVYLGGQAANQVDFIDSIKRGAPIAMGIVVVVTFVLLFLMTGSLLVPLKALIINSLSLAATLGVVTWVFQQGHLEGVLGFESAGGLETYVVVLIIAFGFGLAMDYDLFLLARVKELVDRGVPNNQAVQIGLQRSGRIITSAAAVIVLVFLGFAFGQLLVIKQVGFGLAFAVLLDATVVRMLLVPSTMTLLGKYNWWSPKPLRAFYERFSITH